MFGNRWTHDKVRDRVIDLLDSRIHPWQSIDLSSYLGLAPDDRDGWYLNLTDLKIDRFFSDLEKEFKIKINSRSYYAALQVGRLIASLEYYLKAGVKSLP
jgi:hypothetical protein